MAEAVVSRNGGETGAPAARVLLVDDEPEVTEALSVGMRGEGFRIRTARSAEAALELLGRESFDVVVSDERMPGMLGSSFLRQVAERWPATQRIMLSGFADADATLRAINEAHVYRFLVKPCAAGDVAFCIRQADEARRQLQSRVAPRAPREPVTPERFATVLGGLRMAYQPVVEARGRRLVAHEALMRSPLPAFRSPDRVVEAAEALGLTDAMDRAIRGLIAADMPRLPPTTQVLVNLHPRSLFDPDLFRTGTPFHRHADRFILEITERERLDDEAALVDAVTKLRAIGYRIAVDDLGAGYAGLSLFARVTPEFVKFDRELIHGIDQSLTRERLVASMAALCRGMGIRTLAEGVENQAECDRSEAIGCDLLQGFAVGMPRPLPS